METLVDSLKRWSALQPDKRLWTYLDDDGAETSGVTYAEAEAQSSILASALIHDYGLKPGDRVLLVYPPSLSFILSFMACIRAGLIAVPVYPPDPRKVKKDISAFTKTSESCGARIALTSSVYGHAKKASELKTKLARDGVVWPELQWVVTDKIKAKKYPKHENTLKMEDVAFLQYTSGSTSDPKGVKITHGNLAHNLSLIITELKASSDTVVVSWLPLYHDMGLIGSLLGTLYCGGTGYYMSPMSFIRFPIVWVKSISKYRGTHMQAPNFAYGLCARKWRESRKSLLPELDLSSVKHMINGAEPIDEISMSAFYEVFCPYGLPQNIIFPTYGLAEHTVFVCSGGVQKLRVEKEELELNKTVKLDAEISDGTKVLVGCGYPFHGEGVELKIVDPETRLEVPEDKVGEIWVNSSSKAHGYWNLYGKSVNSFCAKLGEVDDMDEEILDEPQDLIQDWSEGYLRTGDEGFLHKKELFVCGRIKDMIIISGRNYYPQDIEICASSSRPDVLRPGCSAAFSVEKYGVEELILSCEVRETLVSASKEDLLQLSQVIMSAVRSEIGVNISHLLLVLPKSNPKTTSGKIARQWCKRAFLAGTLNPLYESKDIALEETIDQNSNSDVAEGENIELPSIKNDDSIISRQPIDPAHMSDEELQQRVHQILSKIAVGLQIAPDRPIHELGLDSLSLAQFSGQLEQEFECRIPVEALYAEEMTLQTLVQAVRSGGVADGFVGCLNTANGKGDFETWLTNSCPCCLCLANCFCFR